MTRMASVFIGAGALGCLVGVIAGAFGAHALEHSLTPERLVTWGKGVDYLFIHALGLILVGVLDMSGPRRCHRIAGAFMMAGTVLSVLPVMLLFLLLQKEFIRGLTSGAIKG